MVAGPHCELLNGCDLPLFADTTLLPARQICQPCDCAEHPVQAAESDFSEG
jgi:hypothetical protein